MILNGEFDFLTPRALHETLRVHIPDSSLVIIPGGYHAFTLEKPALTADLLARFAEDVLAKRWQGNQAVWIAPEEPGGAIIPFPAGYDHLRAIPSQGSDRMSAFLGPLDSDGRVPPSSANAGRSVSDLRPWCAGEAACVRPARTTRRPAGRPS